VVVQVLPVVRRGGGAHYSLVDSKLWYQFVKGSRNQHCLDELTLTGLRLDQTIFDVVETIPQQSLLPLHEAHELKDHLKQEQK